MDKLAVRSLWALLTLLTLRVSAACTSYGVDYSNGGSYYIDGSSNDYFSFASVFQGCTQETINPVLVDPNNNAYACSAIKTQPAGAEVTSTCGIPFSSMVSGNWKIIISGTQISSQRAISFTVGVPQTTWVTATPTVVVGYTTTAKALTVLTTVVQTETLIIVARTVTAPCSGATRTVTASPQAPTVVVTSTAIRTVTDGQSTGYWTTTVTATASCHYSRLAGRDGQVVAGVAAAAVAAVTSTYTETTRTVTSTVTTTVAGRTTTETVQKTTTATVTPPATTICAGGKPDATVTVTRGIPTSATLTDIVYLTSHLSGTVWIGQTAYTTYTNSASATACWRSGGQVY